MLVVLELMEFFHNKRGLWNYFNEKLSDVKLQWFIYDKKFYIAFQTIKKKEHYLIGNEFVLHYNHKVLRFLHNQRRISNDMYARQVTYLQRFPIIIAYKTRIHNKVVDALSRRATLLITLKCDIIRFDCLKKLYEYDEDFNEVWKKCQNLHVDNFYIHDGFLMKENQFCIPHSLLQEKVIHDFYGGGLASHLEKKKLLMLLLTCIISLI